MSLELCEPLPGVLLINNESPARRRPLVKPLLHILFKPVFLHHIRRKPVRFSRIGLRSRLVNPQFVTFLENTKFQRENLDKHERRMRRRTVWTRMSILIAVLVFGWLIIESAQALSLF